MEPLETSGGSCQPPPLRIPIPSTVKLERRYQNQIEALRTVFKKVLIPFGQQKPIDSWLTHYFRQNRRFGSRDRKLISGSIFGFFRWYGWLKTIRETKESKALLLGYLLDGNEISNLVLYWAEQEGVDQTFVESFGGINRPGLKEKEELIRKHIPSAKTDQLVPTTASELSGSQIESIQTRPGIWIRLTRANQDSFFHYLKERNIDFRVDTTQNQAVKILNPVNINQSVDYKKGSLEVQDISSQSVGFICDPAEGDVWWDVCAGSGGKALHLADLMSWRGLIYATETDGNRFHELKKRTARTGQKKIFKLISWSGNELPSFSRKPDHVLVDAPCSCSGTWRRSPEIRWYLTKRSVEQYANLQFDILSLAGRSIPKQGKLIYATCSILREENELVVQRFLEANSGFQWESITCPFTGKVSPQGLRIQPPEVDGNFMYIAKLRRA